ncbi:MAG: hypothetical protein J0I96_15960 [Rhodanobacter sp.]|nr:hypothetical protein [Rhodanobacter sp.]ODU92207.1 MAG: hypothetical protein ABT18_13085 [Rhodanobacter sp. SCN 66-43]
MSGFDDDFLAAPAPAPAPAPSAQGAAAAPSPPASSLDDFDGFGVSGGSAEQGAGLLSPEAAAAAKAKADMLKAKSGAAMASAARASQAGAQRVGQAIASVSPRQWATGLGVLALVVGLSLGVRWWLHRPSTPVVATAKAEASVAPTASTAVVATLPVVTTLASQKPTAPVIAATMPAAPAIAPTTPPSPAVERHAPRPVVVSQKKDPWKVAHAADIQKSMHADQKKTDDAWAKDQAARLDAFFKKKH